MLLLRLLCGTNVFVLLFNVAFIELHWYCLITCIIYHYYLCYFLKRKCTFHVFSKIRSYAYFYSLFIVNLPCYSVCCFCHYAQKINAFPGFSWRVFTFLLWLNIYSCGSRPVMHFSLPTFARFGWRVTTLACVFTAAEQNQSRAHLWILIVCGEAGHGARPGQARRRELWRCWCWRVCLYQQQQQ